MRSLVWFVVTLCLGAVSAEAAPKDAQAEKAYKQAMEEDYLDTKFDDAEKKIKKAIDTCGESGCAPKVKAKLHMAHGIILAGGKNKLEEAKEAFGKALEIDASVQPDPDYVKSEIKFAFEEAKKERKTGSSGAGGTGGGSSEGGSDVATDEPVKHTPPPEQAVNTPIPIYVALDDATSKKANRVKVMYVPLTNGSSPKTLKLERSGKAFRGNIPCGAVESAGTLKYWIIAEDKSEKVIATVGSDTTPNVTAIRNTLEGKPPSWPGFPPPESCGESMEALRAKSSLRQCVDTADCPAEEACTTNECVLKPKGGGGGDGDGDGETPDEPSADGDKRSNWITVAFAPDFAIVSGEGVCSSAVQESEHFVCLREAGVAGNENPTRYTGTPQAGAGNNVNTGFGVATMRLMLGYDRVLVDNFAIGARVGWAFRGTTDAGASFIPVHAEARASYAFGSSAYTDAVVRPWVFVAGGLAQVDTAVEVQVLEDETACGPVEGDNCNPEYTKAGGEDGRKRLQTLTAAKQAGLGFIGGGAGISFVPTPLFAINLGVKIAATIPVVLPVFSPEIGFALGF